jgi:hypothetical protein
LFVTVSELQHAWDIDIRYLIAVTTPINVTINNSACK